MYYTDAFVILHDAHFHHFLRHFAFGMSSLTYGGGDRVCVQKVGCLWQFYSLISSLQENRVAFQIQLMCV